MFETPAWLLFYLSLVIICAIATEKLCILKIRFDPAPNWIKGVVGILWPIFMVVVIAVMFLGGDMEDIEKQVQNNGDKK